MFAPVSGAYGNEITRARPRPAFVQVLSIDPIGVRWVRVGFSNLEQIGYNGRVWRISAASRYGVFYTGKGFPYKIPFSVRRWERVSLGATCGLYDFDIVLSISHLLINFLFRKFVILLMISFGNLYTLLVEGDFVLSMSAIFLPCLMAFANFLLHMCVKMLSDISLGNHFATGTDEPLPFRRT